jgi:predicted RNase H-like HicB family nuclease
MAKAPLYYVIWQEGKHFVSQCLNVDVSSFGESREEAIQNLNEAVALYFEDDQLMQHEVIEGPEIVSMPLENA